MNTLLKAVCLAIYLGALVGLVVPLPGVWALIVAYGALLLLGGHVLEIFVAYRSIRRYPGGLAASLALTVLFGFLHWLPLARDGGRAAK